jgi:hypothetical protein
MRQRTLGIIAGALMLGGAALEIGTGIAAANTTAPPAAISQRPALHRQPMHPGQFGPGFQRPGAPPPAFPGGGGPGI